MLYLKQGINLILLDTHTRMFFLKVTLPFIPIQSFHLVISTFFAVIHHSIRTVQFALLNKYIKLNKYDIILSDDRIKEKEKKMKKKKKIKKIKKIKLTIYT